MICFNRKKEDQIEKEMTLSVISATIQTRRQQLNLSVANLAKLTNARKRDVRRWESGKHDFKVSELISLERSLGQKVGLDY